ncbi:hypothetical protein ACVNPZ_10585 [Staphylococcus aureus]
MVLALRDIAVLPEHFPHGVLWYLFFLIIPIGLVIIGWLGSVVKNKKSHK